MKKEYLIVGFVLLIVIYNLINQPQTDFYVQESTTYYQIYIEGDFSGVCKCDDICECSSLYDPNNVLNKVYSVEAESDLYTFLSSLVSGYASLDMYSGLTVENMKKYTISFIYKINLNTASYEELDSIDGFGEVTVTKILESRENLFSSTYDLVTRGIIGDTAYEKIKDSIVV